MRQKDFNEVARVLGNEMRHCPPEEVDGIVAAFEALRGHAQYAYPAVDTVEMTDRWHEGAGRGL